MPASPFLRCVARATALAWALACTSALSRP
jgi:hypothetical protein